MNMKEKSNYNMDMLNGGLAWKIFIFAMPLAASSILQQLFNSADVAVVGQFAGSDALAAVGSNAPVTALFVNIFIGLSVGVNVAIANYVGQKKPKHVNDIVHTSMAFAFICGLIILAAAPIISKPLLKLIDTPSDVLDQAALYLSIYLAGMPFIIVYNFGAAILRSIGDTRRPLYCLIITGIINVALNLLLVCVFKLGVAGVAIATTISNAISSGIVMYILIHEEEMLRFSWRKCCIKRPYLAGMLRIGIPSALQSAVFCLSNILIQSGINSFGSKVVAGSSTGLNFEYFCYFVVSAFSQAAITFVGQNYGAGYNDRCKRIVGISMLEGILLTAALGSVFMIFGHFFVSLYTPDEVVIEYALVRMRHVMLFEFMTATYEITAAALRGMGDSLIPAVITIFGSVVFRIIWLYTVFVRFHSFGMLVSVYLVSWIITGTVMIIRYLIISRRKLQTT